MTTRKALNGKAARAKVPRWQPKAIETAVPNDMPNALHVGLARLNAGMRS